ncbi:MAG: hypothetical protein LBR38_05290 [Synergistaceae bacterium]|jgi:hypothetical protein|nr:hypothetical protein [Synergistaceae bacterium]
MGFAGLADMASDVDFVVTPEKKPPSPAAPVPPTPQNRVPKQQWIGRAMFILVIISMVVLFFGEATRQDVPHGPQTASPAPSYSPQVTTSFRDALDKALPDPDFKVPNEMFEYDKPPVGKDNLLTLSQIRWVLREEIRINAMRGVVTSNSAISKFNRMVDDFNVRAGSFRYYERDMNAAKRDVELRRAEFEAAAVREAMQWR